MNWYKKAQRKNRLSELLKGFSMGSIIGLIGWMGIGSMADLQNNYVQNPQAVEQKIVEYQNTAEPEIEQTVEEPEISQPTEEPQVAQSANIDLDKIWMIESTKGTDPNMGKSTAGARGHFQFMKKTWDEVVGRMGQNWDWENGSMDYDKSSQVAEYYLNDRIPYMLNYYGIPDNIETRLGAYSWGIGHLRKLWDKTGENWLEYAPQETQDYMMKYRG